MATYSEPTLAMGDQLYTSKAGGPLKYTTSTTVSIKVPYLGFPTSPASTTFGESLESTSPNASWHYTLRLREEDPEWIVRQLEGLHANVKQSLPEASQTHQQVPPPACTLDLEPDPAFLSAPGERSLESTAKEPSIKDKLVALTVDVRSLTFELEHWKQCALQADQTKKDLQEAQEREREVSKKVLESRIARQDAENVATQLQSENRQQGIELSTLRAQLEDMKKATRTKDEKIEALTSMSLYAQTQQREAEKTIEKQKQDLLAKDQIVSSLHEELRLVNEELLRSRRQAQEAAASRQRELEFSRRELQDMQHIKEALAEERRRSEGLQDRLDKLEALAKIARIREVDATREAEFHRSRAENQEVVSQKLRLDIQDMISGKNDWMPGSTENRSETLPAVTTSTTTVTTTHIPVPPSAAREITFDTGLRRPFTAADGRRQYPNGSVTRRLRQEVVSARGAGSGSGSGSGVDRTSAMSRYDSKGRLKCFDSQGRLL
eukprot:CAMPEP_0206448912 /NCGR_PEP_ID=MMETSP0324_2-20121206/17774_1 /ASSEMBLY_ACC=CAM_ASM_000836 /TAXON_ID=2866 /ORGANISM="Crypthecodinium cohnii, Strain Seligo" /LENGTH=493 /DNA_ID=CAMNT_0053918185 /DNA_START=117 /DNA_END=1598 /DNA_ORIENTATION=-